MMQAPSWKRMNNGYEISEEGQVRRLNDELPLRRFWVDWDDPAFYPYGWHPLTDGELCVSLRVGEKVAIKPIWELMETYWPNVHFPQQWKGKQ